MATMNVMTLFDIWVSHKFLWESFLSVFIFHVRHHIKSRRRYAIFVVWGYS